MRGTISEIKWKLQTYNIINYILSLDCTILSKSEVNGAIIKKNDIPNFVKEVRELSLKFDLIKGVCDKVYSHDHDIFYNK